MKYTRQCLARGTCISVKDKTLACGGEQDASWDRIHDNVKYKHITHIKIGYCQILSDARKIE